ncbi:MAG: hypothetical protein ACON5B_16815 [Myxococcota bacterium]
MTRLLALVMMMACASAPPQRVVLNYVKAEQTRDYDKAHDLLTTSDQRARPLAAFVKEHLAAGPIWLALAETTRFEVVGVEEIDADRATVTLVAEHPTAEALQTRLISAPRYLTQLDGADLQVAAWLAASVRDTPAPMVLETLSYTVRQDDNRWRLWLGLDLQDQAIMHFEAVRSAIDTSNEDAARKALADLSAASEDPGGVVHALRSEAQKMVQQRFDAP